MSKPMITIYDCATGETVEREMTNTEFSQYQKDVEASKTRQVAAETNATAKAALLDKLGITAEEAALLLS